MNEAQNKANFLFCSVFTNSLFARSRGYRFLFRQVPNAYDRHPSWAKIKFARQELPFTRVVLFVDSDAFVRDFTSWIEELLPPVQPSKSDPTIMVIAREVSQRVCHGCFDRFNCGIWLMRNSSTALQMLDEWYRAPLEPTYKQLQLPTLEWSMEQRSFHRVVYDRYAAQIKVVDYDEINGHNGRYVRHFSGFEHIHRSTILADVAFCTLLYVTMSAATTGAGGAGGSIVGDRGGRGRGGASSPAAEPGRWPLLEGAKAHLANASTALEFFDYTRKRFYLWDPASDRLTARLEWDQNCCSGKGKGKANGKSGGSPDRCTALHLGLPFSSRGTQLAHYPPLYLSRHQIRSNGTHWGGLMHEECVGSSREECRRRYGKAANDLGMEYCACKPPAERSACCA